jgi:hypothetical protein
LCLRLRQQSDCCSLLSTVVQPIVTKHKTLGQFGLTYLNLSTGINTCDIV